jgi:hypothetical protein
MLRRPWVIAFLFLLAILLWWVFEFTRPLPGLEPKGGPENWMPWISLATSVISLLTGIIALALKLVEMRGARPRNGRA